MTPAGAGVARNSKNAMGNKNKILRFRAVNRDIFKAIISGEKRIETRAATKRYRDIKAGDTVTLICGREKANKKVSKVEFFKSVSAVLKRYKPEDINPKTRTAQEARSMWYSFPGYREKIKKYGLVAMHLK
jgi:ASC-1-like (ASCH) protein